MELENEIELASRRTGAVEVRLLWRPGVEALTVSVADEGTGEAFEIPVPGESALDAFYHPYAYAPA